ncbi:uncharacterized protein Gasu_16750 [Galdieria sulphuraria]|uniref:Uncharacterized protein n=1 Tax=Galdieria sulphuraria TaxID=130081 RepID=M2XLW3_GALSU|nr:uncharacterized protein Gasu_16750 [Galdieria sulphuraria]EME31182.1 hypothetical protein Gasu_16750 [Galdieria sulphuraria]|eukprot:XP_005707702.1 hypothetical protein Gasu_16750 [Galdieria sulphuraria]
MCIFRLTFLDYNFQNGLLIRHRCDRNTDRCNFWYSILLPFLLKPCLLYTFLFYNWVHHYFFAIHQPKRTAP